jgi:hypothetical protein
VPDSSPVHSDWAATSFTRYGMICSRRPSVLPVLFASARSSVPATRARRTIDRQTSANTPHPCHASERAPRFWRSGRWRSGGGGWDLAEISHVYWHSSPTSIVWGAGGGHLRLPLLFSIRTMPFYKVCLEQK